MIEIVAPGPLCTVQDLGRAGLGAPRRRLAVALRIAPRTGSPTGSSATRPTAATLECTFGGLRVRFDRAVYVALAGADCPAATSPDARRSATGHAVALAAGTELMLGAPRTGLRTYLAVRGGVDAPARDGLAEHRSAERSRSSAARRRRSARRRRRPRAPTLPVAPRAGRRPSDHSPITLWPGPRHRLVHGGAHRALAATPYDGAAARATASAPGCRRRTRAVGAPRAAVRRASSTAPCRCPTTASRSIFLADHGVTGGYPVIAVVDPADIGRVAQARPGERLRFRWSR